MSPLAPKNIVICLDGTGNQFKEHNSNIVKLYSVLDGTPVEGERSQEAYYDPGVGTLADPSYKTPVGKGMQKALGLAFGRGLTQNIQEVYSYLMDTYREGDRVYLFGFSRGAYTVRALAGFIYCCGLLHKGCQNLIPYAMKLYKKVDLDISKRFRATYGRDCPIHFLGLFDTVTTFGFVYDPITLPYTTNNPGVRTVRHAIAIDERRVFFRQNRWSPSADQNVKEVWFAGVHSDVGGGYAEPESGLAKIALKWMTEEAREQGLRIDEDKYRQVVLGEGGDYTAPSPKGQMHTSLKGPWWSIEYLPQRAWSGEKKKKVWRRPRPNRPRTIKEGYCLHQSVLDRMDQTDYAPPNLPPREELPGAFVIEGTA